MPNVIDYFPQLSGSTLTDSHLFYVADTTQNAVTKDYTVNYGQLKSSIAGNFADKPYVDNSLQAYKSDINKQISGYTYYAGNGLLLSGNTFTVTGLTPSINYIGLSGISVNGNQISYTGSTNYVDLTTNQTIGGNKNFTNPITCNGIILYGAYGNDTINATGVGRNFYLDANGGGTLATQNWVSNNYTYQGLSGISVNGNIISYTGLTGSNYIAGNGISISANTLNKQILFNNNGIVTGSTSLTYDYNNQRLNFGINNTISGNTSGAFGYQTVANGNYAFAFGYLSQANGIYSNAEGINSRANGIASHAEGQVAFANGDFSHAEGLNTRANGTASHAEGGSTANGDHSHSQNGATVANGAYSHAGGYFTNASGLTSFSHYHNISVNANLLGANADYSAILGGLGGLINPSGIGNSLISGSGDTVPTGYTYTTFVKSLYALNSNKPIIIRNSGGTESYLSVDNNNQLNFNGLPIIGASSSPNYQIILSNYTTLPSDQYLECSGTTSLVLLTSGITAGKSYEIFNNGSSSVTTITTSTGALINGLSNKVLNIPNQTAKAVWNGTEIKLYY